MNIIKPMKAMASISALCTVIAFSSITSVSVSANEMEFDSPRHHQRGGDYREHMMKRMIKKLSLSEAQQAQIKSIKAQAREQHEMLGDSIKKFKSEESTLLQAQVFDEQAYTALHAAYQPTFAEMALTRAKTKNAVFNVLTTEQQEKWLEVMENRKEKFNKKRG
jgi:protein CpxP